MTKTIRIHVYGQVWKRGFRFYSMQKAVEYGIRGNVSYGKTHHEIIIHAEGEEQDIEKFLQWCSYGSPSCRVLKIETAQVNFMDFKTYDIIEN